MGTPLKKGDQAPDFTGKDQNGNTVSLSDYKGDRLVLFFYPKDDTPGCTKEACNLRDNYKKLQDAGFKILGVSADDEASHQKFIDKYSLPFPLIADTDKSIINDYGVWGEKNMYGKKVQGLFRTTFIINADGEIHHVFKRVKTDNHTEQIFDKA